MAHLEVKKGDKITVFDPFTVFAPYMWPTAYDVLEVEADYYLCRQRTFETRISRVPKTYQHIRIDAN